MACGLCVHGGPLGVGQGLCEERLGVKEGQSSVLSQIRHQILLGGASALQILRIQDSLHGAGVCSEQVGGPNACLLSVCLVSSFLQNAGLYICL